MTIFIKTIIALVPLAWYTLEGEAPRYLTALIGLLLTVDVGGNGAKEVFRQKWIWLWAGCYFVAELLTQTPGSTIGYKNILLLSYYGLMAGICLSRYASKQQRSVLLALAVYSTMMAALAVYVLRVAGVDSLVSVTNTGIERGSSGARIVFLGFFSISNVIIGIVAYTIYGFSWLPVLLLKVHIGVRLVAMAGFLLAIYANTQTLTRTNFAAIAVSFSVIYFLQLKSAPELRRKLTIVGIVGALVGVSGVYVQLRHLGGLEGLWSRFSETDSDSRLIVWSEASSLMLGFPNGGGLDHLTTHLWAHNLFLDVALTAGWFGGLAMVALITTITLAWVRLLKRPSALADPIHIFMLSCTLMVFIASMIHPPLPHYFAWLMLSGSFAGSHLAFCRRPARNRTHVDSALESVSERVSYGASTS